MDERRLVERAREGDRSAMCRLYEAHAGRVYSVVRRLAGRDDLADDLSQEAWIRAFEKLHLFRGESSFGTWMYRLATNTALNHLRSASRHRDLEEQATREAGARVTGSVDEAVINQKVLGDALDRLPPGYREVLVLHDVEGLTHREIGEKLDIATGTSKSQLHKARARMQELITAGPTMREVKSDG
ncbi:MAG: RNA polymerase sigma factor [Gemmatimonadota bacterium]